MQIEIRKTQRSSAMQGDWFKVWTVRSKSESPRVQPARASGQGNIYGKYKGKHHQGRCGLTEALHVTRIY